ncbi:Uncharacterized protein dnm_005340 [Desulfonema magnum]|uniref:Uncharacterized protein n=1 Tax=Desulfonema magnum TaxID=45655 RepID=A0A975GKE1_9BACT|nr:Uncharacterized protein dnm_005340 [Desulfonema magnum]
MMLSSFLTINIKHIKKRHPSFVCSRVTVSRSKKFALQPRGSLSCRTL